MPTAPTSPACCRSSKRSPRRLLPKARTFTGFHSAPIATIYRAGKTCAELGRRRTMARKKQPVGSEYVLFDVVYEDGTRASNRKVPSDAVGGLDGDSPARDVLGPP